MYTARSNLPELFFGWKRTGGARGRARKRRNRSPGFEAGEAGTSLPGTSRFPSGETEIMKATEVQWRA